MIIRRHSKDYNFYGDTRTGLTLRWADKRFGNPVRAPWPELADISISNHCSKACAFCYRDSSPDHSFMTVEQYDYALSALQSERWGNVFQVALGGGEPLEHPDFTRIIEKTNARGIVANFTTNGLYLDKSMIAFLKGKIGALALSADSMDSLDTGLVKRLAEAGIKTNIHFILNRRSIGEAAEILSGHFNERLKGANGVVFLTYKPKGRAERDMCLVMDDALMRFVSLIDNHACTIGVGFDACFVPLLMKYTGTSVDIIDSCECGFFSVYIDEKLNVKPCSFADERFSCNLMETGMETIWERNYEEYRNEMLKNKCMNECGNKADCRGRCMYFDTLSFCYQA